MNRRSKNISRLSLIASLAFILAGTIPNTNANEAGIEHGTIVVTESPSFSVSFTGSETNRVTLLPGSSNSGDYQISVDPPGSRLDGVLITTPAKNGSDSVRYPTVSPYPLFSAGFPRTFVIPVHEPAQFSRIEDNIDVGFVFFSWPDFVGAYAGNGGVNGGPLLESDFRGWNVELGQELVDEGGGVFTVNLTLSNHPERASDKGILLVTSAKQENNYALSRANSDGTYTIYSHDNGVDKANYERDPISFAFIPINHGRSDIPAMGRIRGDGSPVTDGNGDPIAAGDFTITKGPTGIWYLTIPGRTNLNGTLVLSPEGNAGNGPDNIWSYEWDSQNQRFVIESRDIPTNASSLPATSPQNIGASTPAFSFLYAASPRSKIVFVDQNAVGGQNTGANWTNAYTDLQTALTNATPNTDIRVSQGTYTPGPAGDRSATFALKNTVRIFGGFQPSGGDRSFAGRDPDTYITTLSGDLAGDDAANYTNYGENAYRVVTSVSNDFTACIDGFTIAHGFADGSGNDSEGAGMHITDGNPVLSNLLFLENVADDGGGLFLSNADPEINHSSFTANRGGRLGTSNGLGGAMHLTAASNPVLTHCDFANNATTIGGGSIWMENSSSPQLTDCTFTGESADFGGAIEIRNQCDPVFTRCDFMNCSAIFWAGAVSIFDNCDPDFTDCTFTSNSSDGDSGAIRIRSDCNPVFVTTSFTDNEAGLQGGAIDISDNVNATFTASSFTGNDSGDNGGAICIDSTSVTPSVVMIDFCSFSDNDTAAGKTGGALYSFGANTVSVVSCQFTGNDSSRGGAISTVISNTDITNCAFSGNSASQGACIFQQSGTTVIANCSSTGNTGTFGNSFHYFLQGAGSSATVSNNIFWDASPLRKNGGAIDPAFTNNLIFGAAGAVDPAFTDPDGADDVIGTADDDLRPQPDSPVINVGNNSLIPAGITTDLDSNSRIIDTTVDLGAFEQTTALDRSIIYVDQANPNTFQNGASWSNAFSDLQDGIAVAVAGSEIRVAEGTYKPGTNRADAFVLPANVTILGGFPTGGGTPAERNPNPATNNTTLSGDIDGSGTLANNSYHVVDALSSNASSHLDGFTITGGNSDSGSGPNDRGGGITVGAASPKLSNLIFLENRARFGGGLHAGGGGAAAELTNVAFLGNYIDIAGGSGGACYLTNGANLVFNNVLFAGNYSSVLGGAMRAFSSFPVFTNCTVAYNESPSGGAFYLDGGASPLLYNSIFWGNTANTFAGPNAPSSSGSDNLVEGATITGYVTANTDPSFFDTPTPGTGGWTIAATNNYGNLRFGQNSPAYDTGDDTLLPAGVTTDLDGNPRVIPADVELGAYEFNPMTKFGQDVDAPVSTGAEFSSAGWAPDTSGFNSGNGLTFTFTLLDTTGSLAFDALPVVDPDGTLRFTLTEGTLGTATFEVVASDPGMLLDDSAPMIFTFSSGTIHYVDENAPGPTHDGTSWNDAFLHLQDAIDAAAAGNEIWVAEGIYRPDEGDSVPLGNQGATYTLPAGVKIYGGFPTGGGDGSFTARDVAMYDSILSGDLLEDDDSVGRTDNSYRIVTASNADAASRLDGFTIKAGNAFGTGSFVRGAALFNFGGSPTVANCSFEDNAASSVGGAIYTGNAPDLILADCSFTNNSAPSGGAVYTLSNLTVTRCTFDSNHATTFTGGAINSIFTSWMLTDSTFTGNTGALGGGAVSITGTPNATISNCTFEGNSSATGSGGAIVHQSGAGPDITDCAFVGNSCGASGGALSYQSAGTDPSITNCTFTGNDAAIHGGAVSLVATSPTVTNCSVQGNNATNNGGGFWCGSTSSVANSNVAFVNCIIWYNHASSVRNTTSASVFTAGNSTPTYSHCLVENFDLTGSGPGNFNGALPANDPLFITPTDPAAAPVTNGDLHLSPLSPLIGQGLNSANTLPTDLDGNPRIAGTNIELGPYELALTFALLFPAADPNADLDENGYPDYYDYAAGGDLGQIPFLFGNAGNFFFQATRRTEATDVFVHYQKSTDLTNWSDMVESVDYTVDSTTTLAPGIEQITLQLLNTPDPVTNRLFFWRQKFSSTPPAP